MSRKTTTKKAKLRAPRHTIRRRTTKPAAPTVPVSHPPAIPPAMTLVACPMCGTSVFRAGLKGHLIYACSLRGSDAATTALMALDLPQPKLIATTNGKKTKPKRVRA